MTVLTETSHSFAALIWEASPYFSRKVVTIVSGQDLPANAVLGVVTASGKYAVYDNGAGDGTEVAKAILPVAVDASAADVDATVFVRSCVWNAQEVDWDGQTGADVTDGTADLEAAGIVLA